MPNENRVGFRAWIFFRQDLCLHRRQWLTLSSFHPSKSRAFAAMGFWLFSFMLVWGVSGIYLGIPEPFSSLVDAISNPNANERPGDTVLLWLTWLHFGRWRNGPLKALWAVLGLAPALLFVTGLAMWWNRALRPRLRRATGRIPSSEST